MSGVSAIQDKRQVAANLPLDVVLFRMKKAQKETALWASQRTVSNQLKNQTFSAKIER
jgi:hypothetical protein